jgi:hypothetical protein
VVWHDGKLEPRVGAVRFSCPGNPALEAQCSYKFDISLNATVASVPSSLANGRVVITIMYDQRR